MLVFIYKNGNTDCTNKGISSDRDKIILVGEGVEEIFEVGENEPCLELVKGVENGKCLHAKPMVEKRWTMFGGNFIYSSDSRFSKLNNGNPIKIFDRIG